MHSSQKMRELCRDITACRLCPRLVAWREKVAVEKRRAFRDWDYWGKPVPGFGDEKARLIIVGLAPAAHGGNRTGRPFTGDPSGVWLFRAMHEAGFASRPDSERSDDGMRLFDAYVMAAVRCAPPDNKPTREEFARCAPFVDREWELLKRKRLFLALGKLAFDSLLKHFRRQGAPLPKPLPKFGHGAEFSAKPYRVLSSYHPSQRNTQTGRLTRAMWKDVFRRAREILDTGGV